MTTDRDKRKAETRRFIREVRIELLRIENYLTSDDDGLTAAEGLEGLRDRVVRAYGELAPPEETL